MGAYLLLPGLEKPAFDANSYSYGTYLRPDATRATLFIFLPSPAMKLPDDDLEDDLLDDDDDLDSYASKGGAKASGNPEDRLSAKYADYLMWCDTGSSHDEALDLASMTEEEYTTAEAAGNPDGSGFASLDEVDDFGDDDEDDPFSGGTHRGSSDEDDF